MDEKLLIKFLEKKCTQEELNEIFVWMNESHENTTYLFEMEEAWSTGNEYKYAQKEELDEGLNRLIIGIREKATLYVKFRNIISSLPVRVAAVVAVISLLSLNLYMMIHKSDAGAMNIVEVPRGQRVNLVLSDGTKVWLNSDSKLSYPAKFSSGKREVILSGEGCFDVTKNKDLPFIVHSQDLDIKVHGTKFNVNSYNSDYTSVTLENGSVEVAFADQFKPLMMKPNERLIYSKTDGVSLNKNIDASLSSKWVSGELVFQSVTLKELTRELQRRFDMKIIIMNSNLESQLYTCRFKSNVTIDAVMELLKSTRDLDYSIQDKKILIY